MFKWIAQLPAILEFVAKLIREVEELQKTGEEKKKIVLESTAELLKKMNLYSDSLINFISIAIDAYVLFYNLAGFFTHKK